MKLPIIIVLACCFTFNARAQKLDFTQQHLNPPVIDGAMMSGEWTNNIVSIPSVGGSRPVDVYYQRGDTSLYFAFAGKLADMANPNFPEIYIDLNHSKSTSWEADDFWFHVSATDCESQGAHSVWTNCNREQPEWFARRNWAMSSPDPDSVEIEIPFSKLGIDTMQVDSIGIAFGVSNTAGRFDLWPEGASIDNPSEWATAYFRRSTSTGIESHASASITYYPNPVTAVLTIEQAQEKDYQIVDALGQIIRKGRLEVGTQDLDVSELKPGNYIFRVGTVHFRLIKQ